MLPVQELTLNFLQCLLACVYEKLGAFASGGHLLDGDHIMPVMDKLYGFREFKTVMRAQVVHNCINEGNANAVTISNKFIGYSVSGIQTVTSLYGGGGRNSPSGS
jgi:hypothetical protein